MITKDHEEENGLGSIGKEEIDDYNESENEVRYSGLYYPTSEHDLTEVLEESNIASDSSNIVQYTYFSRNKINKVDYVVNIKKKQNQPYMITNIFPKKYQNNILPADDYRQEIVEKYMNFNMDETFQIIGNSNTYQCVLQFVLFFTSFSANALQWSILWISSSPDYSCSNENDQLVNCSKSEACKSGIVTYNFHGFAYYGKVACSMDFDFENYSSYVMFYSLIISFIMNLGSDFFGRKNMLILNLLLLNASLFGLIYIPADKYFMLLSIFEIISLGMASSIINYTQLIFFESCGRTSRLKSIGTGILTSSSGLILFAQTCLSYYLSDIYQFLYIILIINLASLFMCWVYIEETPLYLYHKGMVNKLSKVLQEIYQINYRSLERDYLRIIKSSLESGFNNEQTLVKWSFNPNFVEPQIMTKKQFQEKIGFEGIDIQNTYIRINPIKKSRSRIVCYMVKKLCCNRVNSLKILGCVMFYLCVYFIFDVMIIDQICNNWDQKYYFQQHNNRFFIVCSTFIGSILPLPFLGCKIKQHAEILKNYIIVLLVIAILTSGFSQFEYLMNWKANLMQNVQEYQLVGISTCIDVTVNLLIMELVETQFRGSFLAQVKFIGLFMASSSLFLNLIDLHTISYYGNQSLTLIPAFMSFVSIKAMMQNVGK